MRTQTVSARASVFCLLALLCSASGLSQGRLLILNCNVPGADVYLDDAWKGRIDADGKFVNHNLEARSYRLSIRKTGYHSFERNIAIENGLDTPIRDPILREAKTSAPPVIGGQGATLRFYTSVPNVKIRINGQYIGSTGADKSLFWQARLGSYTITASKSGYKTQQIRAQVNDILSPSFNFHMEEDERLSALLFVLLIIFIVILIGIGLTFSFKGKRSGRPSGAKFDRYEILGILGRGGMATIYKAKDLETDIKVALKIMDSGYLGDEDLVNKFSREGRAIAEINREYPEAPVVKVYRYGRENNKTNGRPFIAMEILEGENLLKLIRAKQSFSPEYALNIARQVASALKPAHGKGIYHRDVTPDNIIVIKNNPRNPVVRLIDFGVARHEYTSAGTLDGSISGKPPYMSPEQCRGEKVDGRSDIYSLGIIIYTLIMGNPPFVSNNPLEVMKHHEKTPVTPITVDIDDFFKSVIYRMLEKDRSRRYPTIDALLGDLNKSMA